MTDVFSNNAVGALAAAISDSDTLLTLDDTPGANRFYSSYEPGEEQIQRATLTGPDPDVFEIVFIESRSGLGLQVVRGQEGTTPIAWPAGTTLSARITAGMLEDSRSGPIKRRTRGVVLDSSKYIDESTASVQWGGAESGRDGGLLVNGRSVLAGVSQISAYPVLQMENAAVRGRYNSAKQDLNMSYPSVGGTHPVDLGVVQAWGADQTLWRGSIRVPTTPNGYQYWVEFDDPSNPDVMSGTTEPNWGGIDPTTGAIEGMGMRWRPVAMPLDFSLAFEHPLVVTEVGFISFENISTTTPSVSIGTTGAPGSFAANVALTQIAGGWRIHRIPINENRIVYDMTFKLETAATGGFCLGRFYWRGFFVHLP